jgi:hypothetical protein
VSVLVQGGERREVGLVEWDQRKVEFIDLLNKLQVRTVDRTRWRDNTIE